MPSEPVSPARSFAAAAARLALGLALACAVVELLAGPGYRLGWWAFGSGIRAIRWAATAALVAAGVGLLVGLFFGRSPRRRTAWLAVLAGLLVAAPPLWMAWQVQHLPKLHDISTDTGDPPRFVAIVPLRTNAKNSLVYAPSSAELQGRGYPDIVPLDLAVPPARALERAEAAARAMGWEIVAVSPQDLRIEATDTSLLFGFTDDVVIRVKPADTGSRVDVRSASRVGGSDFGVNAKRIRRYLKRLAETP